MVALVPEAEAGLAALALESGGICLVRTDQPRMSRAYRYLVQPDLFGGFDLIREWGRWASRPHRPRRKVEPCVDLTALECRLRDHLRRRLRRGYRPLG
jgi:hypothetical protein